MNVWMNKLIKEYIKDKADATHMAGFKQHQSQSGSFKTIQYVRRVIETDTSQEKLA